MSDDFLVQHGGFGPIPGSDEAKKEGCICPGQVGDFDCWGRTGGFTVDNNCPLHGKQARLFNLMEARASWAETELTLSEVEGVTPPAEILGMISFLADQVKAGPLPHTVLRAFENRQMMVRGTLLARTPKTLMIQDPNGDVMEFPLDQVHVPNDNKHFSLWTRGEEIAFLTSAISLAEAARKPPEPEPEPENKEPTLEEWYAQPPDNYLVGHNMKSLRIIAWCDTLRDRFGKAIPFIVDVWDDRIDRVYYRVHGGPNKSDEVEFLSEWPEHWKWQLPGDPPKELADERHGESLD